MADTHQNKRVREEDDAAAEADATVDSDGHNAVQPQFPPRRMLITHKNFRSIDPRVQDAETMNNYIGDAIMYQKMFDRRTTPSEKSLWGEEELQNFEVDLEKIDRLYRIHYHDHGLGGHDYGVAGRMDYNGRSVFVKMVAGCHYAGFDLVGGGNIFVSLDANLFMKIIITDAYPIDLMRQSLAQDGIQLDDINGISRMLWSSIPMLKYLCHKTVYEHKESLTHYSEFLPKILKNSIDDFIRFQEAKDDYDSWWYLF